MSTIHGASWKALRFLREAPAAVPVFWSYCARVNLDNIAFPSLRALAKELEWSFEACSDGRLLLVRLQALERVENYIRPAWRGLDDKTLKRRLNLDRSEYFKPTGILNVEGKIFDLLYIPSKESGGELDDDDLPRRSSTAPMIGETDQNLVKERELDKKKSKKRARSASRPAAAIEEIGFKIDYSLVEGAGGSIFYADGEIIPLSDRPKLSQAALLLFAEYLGILRELGRAPMNKDAAIWADHQKAALLLALARVTPQEVAEYMIAQYRGGDQFWPKRPAPMKLEHIANYLRSWQENLKTNPPKAATPDTSRATPESPEYPEHRVYSQAEIDALKADADADAKTEAEHGR